ncbi:hypothetical protein KAU92_06540 [Candidatus Bathyarchaeota archaeon]|nr:hypothetical protein [Candidatus Bathyarchaeota archaeon]
MRVGIKLFNPCDWLSKVFWKLGDPDNLEEDASAANRVQKLTGEQCEKSGKSHFLEGK